MREIGTRFRPTCVNRAASCLQKPAGRSLQKHLPRIRGFGAELGKFCRALALNLSQTLHIFVAQLGFQHLATRSAPGTIYGSFNLRPQCPYPSIYVFRPSFSKLIFNLFNETLAPICQLGTQFLCIANPGPRRRFHGSMHQSRYSNRTTGEVGCDWQVST